jgi:hypothetical protein
VHVARVHPPGGELTDLEKRRAGVEQGAHPLARQHLAARGMLVARRLVAADRDGGDLFLQVVDQRLHAIRVGAEFGGPRIDLRLERAHRSSRVRPMTMRWMSLAPS